MRGEFKSMRRATSIHVIDAIFIGGEDLQDLDFKTRNLQVQMLINAMNKPTRPEYVVLRQKPVHGLEHLDELISKQALT